MMACGPLARDVPRRNLRRASLVSWEKEYSLDSEACGGWSVPGGGIWLADGEVSSRTELRGGGWNGGESHHGERAGGGLVEEGVGLRPFNVFELRETDVPAVSRQDGQTRMRLFTEFCSGKECRGPQVSGMMPRIDGPLPSDSIAAPVSCPATRRHRTALHLALDIGSRPRPCSLSERKVTSPNGIDRLNSPGAVIPLVCTSQREERQVLPICSRIFSWELLYSPKLDGPSWIPRQPGYKACSHGSPSSLATCPVHCRILHTLPPRLCADRHQEQRP